MNGMPRPSEAGIAAVELNRIVSAEELRALLDRILASRHFASAGRRKKFLTVVVDYYLSGRSDQLNEFCLGVEVFGFDQHYDPAANASVRVCAHDVRKRLKDYFEQEGAGEKLLIQIPPGAYKPVFLERSRDLAPAALPLPPQEVVTPVAPTTGDGSRGSRWMRPLLLAAVALSVMGSVAFGIYWLRNSERAPGAIWKPLFDSQGAVLVIMSNPPVFQFLWDSDPVRSRQTLVPLGQEALTAIDRELGPSSARKPYLVFSPQDYTGMGEAMGLMHLTRFFARGGREMLVKQSLTADTEDLKNHHVVLVGGPLSNSLLPRSESLDFDLGGNYVLNRKPLAGEQQEYRLTVDPVSGQPATDWAVITVAPGIAPGRVIMVLAGIRSEGTLAAAEFVTEPRYAEQLQRKLEPNPSRFFQALVRVEVKKWQPATLSLEAVHPLPGH
jgi:hypothetical protein